MVSKCEQIQSLLSRCIKDNYIEIGEELNKILHDPCQEDIDLFVRSIFNILPARFLCLSALARVICTINIAKENLFRNRILSTMGKLVIESNNEVVTYFLYYLMKVNYIAEDEVLEILINCFNNENKLNNDVFNQIIMLLIKAGPILNRANSNKLNLIFQHIMRRKEVVAAGLFMDENAPLFECFYENLSVVKNNNWYIPNDFPSNDIIQYLRRDNASGLKELIEGEYSVDFQMEASVLLPVPFLSFSIPIISLAAFYGAEECVKKLIEMGSRLDIKDDEERGIMQFAIAGGNFKIVNLIDTSSTVDFQGCLSVSVEFFRYEIFDWLRHKIHDITNGLAEAVDCPMHAAAKNNSVHFANILLKEGKFHISRDDYNWTPLHCAASYNSIEVMYLLLQSNDIDPNIGDLDGDTPLHCASKEGFFQAVSLLLQQANINPNAIDRHGATPLHYAACYDRYEIVNRLLKHSGITPNAADGFYRTPLHMAANSGSNPSARILINDARVDPNIVDLDNSTALHNAAQYGELNVVETICQSPNINYNIKNNNNTTAIEIAARKDLPEIVCFLANRGADVTSLIINRDSLPMRVQNILT